MRSVLSRLKTVASRYQGQFVSAALHGCLILLIVGGVVRSGPVIAPYKLPGTAQGVSALTFYAPGSYHPIHADAPLKSEAKVKPATVPTPTPKKPQVEASQQIQSQQGLGLAAQSGLGEGDITIALQTYFPYPKPDLTALPHGTRGDVVLDAVIDEHGKIAQLTLLKGLGSPVDDTVIATVRGWTYTPAMKNGVPVQSEQELHFHYERG